jgi:hypothetical protein
MAPSAADILRGTGEDAIRLKDVVGQVFTIVDFVTKDSKKYDSKFAIVYAVNSEGDDVQLMGPGHTIEKLGLLKSFGHLPLDVKVASFDTERGTGYGFDPVD